MNQEHSDALVFFGATGDLAYKKIFPSLQAMILHGHLDVPVIGVAKAGWNLDQLKARAKDSLEKHGGLNDDAWKKLEGLLRYVDGDYADLATFQAVRKELGDAKHPLHYLAIPPAMFEKVIEQLKASGSAEGSRIVVEKPFGHDLASAQELNRILLASFSEKDIFRIDHYLAKGSVSNMVGFRFTNTLIENQWNRDHVESVQITMAEDFGIQGRGPFYDATGTIRDVIQNHLFQILCNLAMEAPARSDPESMRDEKVKVLKAIDSITTDNVVRGQFKGYLDEKGVAPGSQMETFAALKLEINNWRWQGVPFYIRSGKDLPVTCTEVVVRMRRPPVTFISPRDCPQNHVRFRLSPEIGVAIAVSAAPEKEGSRQRPTIELMASRHTRPGEMEPYERALTDAMMGDATLFARQDYVEEAWRIVDDVLKQPTPVYPYDPHTWGPAEVQGSVVPPGGWAVPKAVEEDDFHLLTPDQV